MELGAQRRLGIHFLIWGGTDTYDDCGECGGDNSSCTGCMDPLACDYDPNATIQAVQAGSGSGSLSFSWTSTGSWASEISWEVDGTLYGAGDEPALTLAVGTYTITGYDAYGDGWNGGELVITDDLSGNSVTLALTSGSSGSVDIEVTDGGGALIWIRYRGSKNSKLFWKYRRRWV